MIFVVDSADLDRLDEAKTAFGRSFSIICSFLSDKLLDDESLIESSTPILTLANKQDLPDSLSAGDLVVNFDPYREGHSSSVSGMERPFVFSVSALTW